MEKHLMVICTRCHTMFPIEDIGRVLILANIELKEAVCANPRCDCKIFKIEEVPINEDIYDGETIR